MEFLAGEKQKSLQLMVSTPADSSCTGGCIDSFEKISGILEASRVASL